MKLLNKLTSLFLLTSTMVASTYGTSFDYSYTFLNGGAVTGSFDGTQNGNLITDISNASVFINGHSIDTGLGIFVMTRNANGQFVDGFAQVSIDGLQNDFIFFNGEDVVNGNPVRDHFMSKNYGAGNPTLMQAGDASESYYGYDIRYLSPNNWNVSLRSAQVPETASTFALLGGCVLGLAALRRRFAV